MADKQASRGPAAKKTRGPGPGAERKAELLKALAHPARVAMFEALGQGERTVGELAELVAAKESITSQHLALMRAAGLVATRKEGQNVYYSVKMPCLLSIFACMDEAVCVWTDEQKMIAASLRRGRQPAIGAGLKPARKGGN
jgi:DNA-binding transcriptional ArsR family regulator